MLRTDEKRFKTALLAVAELYGKPPSGAVVTIWWEALKGYEIEAVEAAFARHMQSPDAGQYMPKPADIIRMLAGTSLDASMVAWTKFDKAVRQVGPHQSVAFDDPFIHRVVQDMGGWPLLNTKVDSEWPFVGNEFRARYQGYRSRAETPEYPPRLIGIAEAGNAQRGYAVPQPVLIGDAEKAALVAKGGTDKSGVQIHRIAAAPKTLALINGPEKQPERLCSAPGCTAAAAPGYASPVCPEHRLKDMGQIAPGLQ